MKLSVALPCRDAAFFNAAFLLLLAVLFGDGGALYFGIFGFLTLSAAYQWETVDRKIQLVRLIQHYQEEE